MYNRKFTPEKITYLDDSEIFVFGSNPEGKYTSSAALYAVNKFGAQMGIGEGRSGQSYAIPVHKHRRYKMVSAVKRFIQYARDNQDKTFIVLPIGCGAAGMDSAFVSLMFRDAVELQNIVLPKLFVDELNRYEEIGLEISDDCLTIVRFPKHWRGKYIVPRGIENLGNSSFMGCCCDLELPDTLKQIGKFAFSDMGSFDYCIRIPSSVSSIDEDAFASEWCSPIMLVDYQSYAYNFAKKNHLRYKCVNFDEEEFLKEQKNNNGAYCGLNRYLHAISNKRPVPKGQIAIAREFVIVLNDNGHQTLIGHRPGFKQLGSIDRIVKVVASFSGYMVLTERGTIITCGKAHEFDRSRDIEKWQGVKDVVASEGHTVALFHDGTVESIDESGGWDGVPRHSEVVKEWEGIKQIAVGYNNVMGLTETGQVIYHSLDGFTNKHFYDNCSNVVQIDCYSHYYGTDSSAVLHSNGTVTSDTFDGVESWSDIIQISVGADIIVGLKSDGTIEMIDDRNERYAAKKWKNLASVECKFFEVVGITKDGKILTLKNKNWYGNFRGNRW